MMRIARVTTDQEFEAVYRFRYSMYVNEMDRRQYCADHRRKIITDPLDGPEAIVLGAWEGNELVGTLTSNFLRTSPVGEYLDYYYLRGLPAEVLAKTSITSRLTVHPRLRSTILAARMACMIYQIGLESGIVADFIDCNCHLVPFFTRFGYRFHRHDLRHPERGDVKVMRLDVHDRDHLRRVRSPFLRTYRERNVNRPIDGWRNPRAQKSKASGTDIGAIAQTRRGSRTETLVGIGV